MGAGVIIPDTRGVDLEELRRKWYSHNVGFLSLNEVRAMEGMREEPDLDGGFLVPKEFCAETVRMVMGLPPWRLGPRGMRRWNRKGKDLMRDSFMPRLPAMGTRSLRW